MPRKSIKFDLDFSVKDILPKFKVKQYDDVILNITSFNNKEAYNIEDFQVVMYIACDNDVFMQDSDIHMSGNNIIGPDLAVEIANGSFDVNSCEYQKKILLTISYPQLAMRFLLIALK